MAKLPREPVEPEQLAVVPGENADPPDNVQKYVREELRKYYDIHSYSYAAAILKHSFPDELEQLENALLSFKVTTQEIQQPGGNESEIPKKFALALRPKGWVEARIQGNLEIRLKQYTEIVDEKGKLKKKQLADAEPRLIKGYVDGHKIDYVKGRVAFDLEWNSKEQTFDRDLFAFRTFHECGVISVGVLVTRSQLLNPILKALPKLKKDGSINLVKGREQTCFGKMGASTTWLDKLLRRLTVDMAIARFWCSELGLKSFQIGTHMNAIHTDASKDLQRHLGARRFGTILVDPPWQFQNRTGKVAPEHRRLSRYGTMSLDEIKVLPVSKVAAETSHLYLWVPNALLPDGLAVMEAWGFKYKTNLVWRKVRKDGGSDGRGVGFYFRNVTELLLFGVRGKNARTLAPGRRQVNYMESRKREHSRKPDEQYAIIESCSSGPYLELFARGEREGWISWGKEADDSYRPTWNTYSNHSRSKNTDQSGSTTFELFAS